MQYREWVADTMTAILLTAVLFTAAPETTLLSFGAPWCAHCRTMEPVCQQFAAQGYPLHKIDIDRDVATAKAFNIGAVPTFVVLVDGREMERIEGTTTLAKLTAAYRKHTTTTPPLVDVQRPQLVASDWRPARAAPACDVPPRKAPPIDYPPPVMPAPVPLNPPSRACDDCAGLRAVIDELRAEIANLKRQPGEPGTKGERGPPGEPGAPGKSAEVDYARLADMVASKVTIDVDTVTDAVLAKLPPVKLEVLDEAGNVKQRAEKPLGQAIRIQLKPVPTKK